MFTLYKRDDSPNIYVTIGSGKNRIQKSTETTSKKLAEKRAQLWEEEYLLNQHRNLPKRAKLGQIYLRYAATIERMKKPAHVKRIQVTFKPFLNQYADHYLHSIDIDMIDDYTNGRLDSGLSNKTVYDDITTIKAFFEYAKLRKYVAENPCDHAFRPDKKEKKYPRKPIPWDVVQILLQDASLNGYESDFRFWSVLAYTGLRVSDAGNLSPDDIRGDVITLFPIKTKHHETAVAQIPLHPKLEGIDIFKIYPEFYKRNQSRERMQRRLKWLNYPHRADLHCLRHSLATELANRQVNPDTIRLILGHTNKQQTRDYIHPSIELAREIFNKID